MADNHCEDGPHTIYEIEHTGRRLAFYQPSVGAPLAVGLMEEAIAYGCRKFIACGGCGVQDKEMAVAQHRQVVFGQLLYADDDLSGSEWD